MTRRRHSAYGERERDFRADKRRLDRSLAPRKRGVGLPFMLLTATFFLRPAIGRAEPPVPFDDTFCAATGVDIKLTQRYSDFFGSWFYSLDATNGNAADVRVFISVYDDDDKRQNIWEPKLKSGEQRRVVKDQPFAGANKGHVGKIRFRACGLDRVNSPQCSKYCNYPR